MLKNYERTLVHISQFLKSQNILCSITNFRYFNRASFCFRNTKMAIDLIGEQKEYA
jgi:hypothetical protein